MRSKRALSNAGPETLAIRGGRATLAPTLCRCRRRRDAQSEYWWDDRHCSRVPFRGRKTLRGEGLTERERVLQRPRGKDLALPVETRRSRSALGAAEWSV